MVWPNDQVNTAFITPSGYDTPDIVCHKNSRTTADFIELAAGDTLNLQWTDWPVSHKGPILSYLAPAGGDFKKIDKVNLRFVKIEELGLLRNSSNPADGGIYAADRLINQGNRWQVKIPDFVAPGNYVLRHEIIALMEAADYDKAQHYPQCINLKVTGNGKDPLTSGGVRARDLYDADHPGIHVQIFKDIDYQIPGPEVYQSNNAAPEPVATTLAKRTSAASSKAAPTPAAKSADQAASKAAPTPVAKLAANAAPKDDSTTTRAKGTSAAPSKSASTPAAKFADNAPPKVDSTTLAKRTSSPAAVTTSVGAPSTTLISSVHNRPANATLFPSFVRLSPKSRDGATSAVRVSTTSPVAASTPSGVGDSQGDFEYDFSGFDQSVREPENPAAENKATEAPSPPNAAEAPATPEAGQESSTPKAAEVPSTSEAGQESSTPKAADVPSTPNAAQDPSTAVPADGGAPEPQSLKAAVNPKQSDTSASQAPATEGAAHGLSAEDFEFPKDATMEQIVAFLEKLVRTIKDKVLGGKRKYARDFSLQ